MRWRKAFPPPLHCPLFLSHSLSLFSRKLLRQVNNFPPSSEIRLLCSTEEKQLKVKWQQQFKRDSLRTTGLLLPCLTHPGEMEEDYQDYLLLMKLFSERWRHEGLAENPAKVVVLLLAGGWMDRWCDWNCVPCHKYKQLVGRGHWRVFREINQSDTRSALNSHLNIPPPCSNL